jgi:hypothetical protein
MLVGLSEHLRPNAIMVNTGDTIDLTRLLLARLPHLTLEV